MRSELVAKCLQLIYAQSGNANLASLAGGFLLAVLFWDIADRAILLGWGGAYLLMILYRYRLGLRFRNASPEEATRRWLNGFLVAVFLSGALWGAYAVYLAHLASDLQLAVVVLTVGALLSGAAIAYSVILSAFVAFSLPAMLPVGVYLLAQGRADAVFLGVLVLIWMLFMYRSARRFRDFAVRSLGYQFENAGLLRSLAEERDRATELAATLDRLAQTDSLTGVANRRGFDQALADVWDESHRAGQPMALMFCDVDHFKAYNDAYGHPAGDGCLRAIAGALDEVVRAAGGVTARIGGEEFAVLWAGATPTSLSGLAEQMRSRILALRIPHSGAGREGVVTASFGVAQSSTSPAELMKATDGALYEAKRRGRNRVVVGEPSRPDDL
jgi:diguanylate cyclase (GGDEF)-like protein